MSPKITGQWFTVSLHLFIHTLTFLKLLIDWFSFDRTLPITIVTREAVVVYFTLLKYVFSSSRGRRIEPSWLFFLEYPVPLRIICRRELTPTFRMRRKEVRPRFGKFVNPPTCACRCRLNITGGSVASRKCHAADSSFPRGTRHWEQKKKIQRLRS